MLQRHDLIRRALHKSPALILLTAPGGTGKSVTASQIAEAFVTQTPSSDAVWVRFTTGTAGFEAVWKQVLSTCVKAELFPDNALVERVIAGGLTSVDAVIETLRGRTNPLLLVLDDAHRSVTEDVEKSLLEVLEHLGNIAALITSRRPLKLLSSSEVALRIPVVKFSKADLNLSVHEIEKLIHLRLFNETHPGAVAKAIHRQSKGWPLAAHALLVERNKHTGDAPAARDPVLRRTFVHDIVNALLENADFRTQQVFYLLAQYQEISHRILAEALEIHPDTMLALFDGSLFDYVDYWVDDEDTRWYDVHDLIGVEIFKRQDEFISRSERKSLGKRIALQLRDVRPRTAIQAAIIAEEWELLSDLLVMRSSMSLSRQQLPVTLSDIPEKVLSEYPVIATFALVHQYAFPTGSFGRMVAGFRAYSSPALRAQTTQTGFTGAAASTLKMVVGRLTGDEKLAYQMAEQATQKLTDLTDAERQRYSTPLQAGITQIAITYIHSGHLHEALQHLQLLLEWRDRLQPGSLAHATALAAWAAAYSGDTTKAQNFLEECEQLDVPIGWHNSYIGTGYRIVGALRALENDNGDLAQQHIDALAVHEPTIEHWPYLAYLQALTIESRDGAGAAITYLRSRTSRRNSRAPMTSWMRGMLHSLLARLSWQHGQIVAQVKQDPLGLGSVYAALSRRDLGLAMTRASDLEELPLFRQSVYAHTEILLLQAVILFLQGNLTLATTKAQVATAIMNASKTSLAMRAVPQEIAHELGKLVPELPASQARSVITYDVESLNPSEQRTLIAVAKHGTLTKAANAMFLSRETVKSHMKHVYRKLKVTSRDEAVAFASASGLLKETTPHDDLK